MCLLLSVGASKSAFLLMEILEEAFDTTLLCADSYRSLVVIITGIGMNKLLFRWLGF